MIGKQGTEYYNLEKAAEVLSVSTAEVNRLREQSKLRGFRDGSNWKFQKEDVHNYLASVIKARNGGEESAEKNPGDSDFDLGGDSAHISSFDVLMEGAQLPDENQLVAVHPAPPSSDVDLAALTMEEDSDLALAEETRVSAVHAASPSLAKQKAAGSSFDLASVDDDDDALGLAAPMPAPAVTLDKGHGAKPAPAPSLQKPASAQPAPGESGFDLDLAPAAEEDGLLEVAEDKTEPVVSASQSSFDLMPKPAAGTGADDSASSSQVIAVDDMFGAGGNMAQAESAAANPADAFFGADDDMPNFMDSGQIPVSAGNDPFGSASAFSDSVSTSATPSAKAKAPAEEYSAGTLAWLAVAAVMMLLPGMMMLDLMVNVWSWNEPFVLHSILMDAISDMFGL